VAGAAPRCAVPPSPIPAGQGAARLRRPVQEPDTVRLAAGPHRDFIHLSLENSPTRAGALEVLGSGVDLGAVDLETYS
jgi:poly(3-hydroxyalkanoate) synthetase